MKALAELREIATSKRAVITENPPGTFVLRDSQTQEKICTVKGLDELENLLAWVDQP